MKKCILGLILLSLTTTSCGVLNKSYYLSGSGNNIKRSNSSGGYFSTTILKFGKGNTAKIKKNGYDIEIWSQSYCERELFQGPIVPILPSITTVFKDDIRWIRVTNKTSKKTIIIEKIQTNNIESKEILLCEDTYAYTKETTGTIESNKPVNIKLATDEHIWFGLPESNLTTIHFDLDGEKQKCNLKQSKSLSWWFRVF